MNSQRNAIIDNNKEIAWVNILTNYLRIDASIEIKKWKEFKKQMDFLINYNELLNPLNVIRTSNNTLLFFYEDSNKILKIMNDISEDDNIDDPFNFGYERRIDTFKILDKEYKVINLWYDNEDIECENVLRKFEENIKI